MDSIVTDEAGVWIAGGISLWEIIGFKSELDRSRLHDGIVTCLIASKTTELFKISECRHWVPKFDIWALKLILLLLWLFWYGSWTAEACIPLSY